MRHFTATRYVTPLREGGSLPAVIECDDGSLYVVKFRGAGQGGRALVAEVVAGELARVAGLRVPELALVELDAAFGKSEPDPEIRDLLLSSAGTNLGMAYLPGAVGFDLAARAPVAGELASRVVAFDAFVTNVDRTARNPNMLWWQGELWLIDHGAAFYWQHGWQSGAGAVAARAAGERPFPRIADHVLLAAADRLATAGAELVQRLDDETFERVVAMVPPAWFGEETPDLAAAYVDWLGARRSRIPTLIEEAAGARARRV